MKAGDRIVCIDNIWNGQHDPARKLVKGRVYVTTTTPPDGGEPVISVSEVTGEFVGVFNRNRFKVEKEEITVEKPFPEGASITCIDNSWDKEWGGQVDYAKVTLTEGTEYICLGYDSGPTDAELVKVKDDNGRVNGFFPARFKLTEKKATTGMIPFDMDKFEEGVPVITRDGKPVTQLTRLILNVEERYPLIGVVNGESIRAWTILGKQNSDDDSPYDLYHPVPKYYLCVYEHGRVVTVNKGDGKYEPCELPEGEYEVIPIPR